MSRPDRQPRHRRRRPQKPVGRFTFRRAVFRLVVHARRRGAQLKGGRCQKLLLALGKRQPEVRSGIVYLGTEQMGVLGGQSDRSVQRALPELEKLEVIRITRSRGGKMMDEFGRCVAAAHGYELRPEWLQEPRRGPPQPLQQSGETAEQQSARETRELAKRILSSEQGQGP
jgi:hypothetical protein